MDTLSEMKGNLSSATVGCLKCAENVTESATAAHRIRHQQIPLLSSRTRDAEHTSLTVSILTCLKCGKDVAVHWADRWQTIAEILYSSDSCKTGILQVQSEADHVVLYTLSQILYVQHEIDEDGVVFRYPGCYDDCSIMWQEGKAVGFFTVKPQGQQYASGLSERYRLPVVDLIYVTRADRRRGHAYSVVDEVVSRYPDQDIGFSCPLSAAMWKVLRNFLRTHKKERRFLWATKFTGGDGDRENIWFTLRHCERQEASRNAETVTYAKY